MGPANKARREPLDQASIVAAAIALADEAGVDALTMRRLAERLGFKAMALYNHVGGKNELLALMVDAVAAEVGEPPNNLQALEAARWHAIATRQMFVRHPWVPSAWLRYLPGPQRIDHMENLLRFFDESSLSHDTAHHGFHAVSNHVLGYTLQELAMAYELEAHDGEATAKQFVDSVSAETHPHTVAHVNDHLAGNTGSSFELVLDLILDGLARMDNEQ